MRAIDDGGSKSEGEGPSGDFRGENLSSVMCPSGADLDARLMRERHGDEAGAHGQQ